MRKNLTPIGNSLGIILDRSILSLLKLDRETAFEITTDGRRLLLEPLSLNADASEPTQFAAGNFSPVVKNSDVGVQLKAVAR